jgi:MscS family membrane protein
LLGAIGILLFLIVLAKYLPSLLDFAILSRFKIAGGDRKAITTVVSYIFVIIGLSAAASKMGLRWSQVQWLAAAFSFGLGFGLQDIFANFFSGLVLLFERPMRVGDFCRFGDQLGTVESIGLRSTKVRGLDRTIINVPNADFSKKELINYAKRDRFLLRTTIGLRYETTDEQLRYVLAKLRELLLSHPKMLEEQARVRFVGYGEYSLDIEIFAYALARDWAEFLGIREDVFLRIKLIVEESGSGFAFPSQTHYLSRDQGLDAERTAAAEAQVQTWRSENRLPFPDFSEKQRRLFRDSLDYPPAGSPYAGLHAGPTGNKKARDDRK